MNSNSNNLNIIALLRYVPISSRNPHKVYANLKFQRFAQLSCYLPVLPVFGKGDTLFQPVYVGDVGRLVEILTKKNRQ